ncbi:NupC/NupG family nucleoside CNT transporter [Neobacillus sp. SCS-31]|uniref:NupC/NupG family nucleoside CNT transporter n=1 Tax=Neobacillus oceani TaxID=3115292 RepID=UPI0039068FE8
MDIIRGIIGLAFIFGLGYLISFDRKNVRYKPMAIMIGLQLVITFVSLNTAAGIKILGAISDFFSWLLKQAEGGTNFVFGGIQMEFVFFFHVLMPIVFVSALLGILNYIKVLPFIIKWTGKLINKITGMGDLESYFAPSTAILGQPEVFITIKEQLPKMKPQQLYTICASAMSAVAAATLGAYMTMVPGQYVVVAVFLNIFSALIISCVVNPYDPKTINEDASVNNKSIEGAEWVSAEREVSATSEVSAASEEREPFFQMLGTYILDGFKLVIIVSAMLIGFMALVTLLNNSFEIMFNITFTEIMGWVFAPIAFVLGVPWDEVVRVGSIMATKLITNEFVAMGELAKVAETLSPKANAMISTYLISFANFGTLGIVSGSIKSIDEKQGKIIAKYSVKLLVGATMASMLTATIVGMFY